MKREGNREDAWWDDEVSETWKPRQVLLADLGKLRVKRSMSSLTAIFTRHGSNTAAGRLAGGFATMRSSSPETEAVSGKYWCTVYT